MNKSQIMWRTSTYSTNGADCVEVGASGSHVAVRDSKNPDRAGLMLDRSQLRNLANGLK